MLDDDDDNDDDDVLRGRCGQLYLQLYCIYSCIYVYLQLLILRYA